MTMFGSLGGRQGRGVKRIVLGAAVAASVAGANAGTLRMASVFSDHAVLQRDGQTPIWGEAEPGQAVRVEISRDGEAKFT